MPVAIPIVLGAAGAGVLGASATVGAALGIGTLGATALGVGLTVAGTLAQVLLTPQPPKPKFQDGSQSVKQAVPPRVRCYGRYRLGGAFIEYDSNNDQGGLNTLVCHAAHQCDAVEEHWLNDKVVQIGANGGVTTSPYAKFRAGDASSVYITNYLGTPDQSITIPVDRWTPADHRGRGLCCTYVGYSDLKPEQQQEVFPNGPPAYRATLRGARIFDPRPAAGQIAGNEATYGWSDNAALVVLDYLTRTEAGVPVGFGFGFDRIDTASFAAAADICDQVIPRKPHDPPYPDERRWRAWGAYELTEDRKSVLSDLLDACGGRLIQGPDGRLGLTVGAPNPVAAVTIDDDQVLEYDFSAGKSAIERVNEVRATYVSQEQDWAEVEAGIQHDQDAIDRNGVESSQIKLRFVPSEGQAQRVARSTLKRGNPSWAGKIRGTLALLDAWGERWVRLQLSELAIDQLFEITSMRLDRTTMSVEMEVTSYDGWWDWNPATDEADPAPIPDDDEDEPTIPVPSGVAVAIEHRSINGQSYAAIGVVSWAPPPRPVFVGQVRYRPVTTPESPWQQITAEQDATTVLTEPLRDNQGYEAQARFLAPRGSAGDWSASVTFTAVADPIAPDAPTGLTAQANAPGAGQVTVTATQPNNPRASSLRFYRNSSNSFAGATLLPGMPLYAGPGGTRSVVDTPGAGDWWYFATSANWSGVQSAPAGGVLAELAPAAPTITNPSGPTTTYDRRPTVSGTALAGSAIRLYANAVQVGSGTADGAGNWTVTPSTDLGLGANAMTATATVAGNESVASGAVTITVNAIDSDAWAYISAMTVQPTYARQTLINDLVGSLKSAGVWAKLDTLYLLAAHDAQAARLNAKAPANWMLGTSGGPVFTADHGYKGTGLGATAGGYLTSTFVPSTAGGLWQLNSAHLGVYIRTASTSTASLQEAEIGVTGAYIAAKHATAGNISTSLNDGTNSSTPAGTPVGTGHFCTSRTASTGYAKYHDGVAQTAASAASTSLPSSAVSILRATTATYSDAEVCAAHWGLGLSAQEVSDLRTALHTYLAAVRAVA